MSVYLLQSPGFDMTDLERHIEEGMARLEAISRTLDRQILADAAAHELGKQAAKQPWLVAGVSDGMGLHTVIAALDAGLLKYGLGVYWEPPHFLELREDGTPVSPVHFARYQNALALERYAAERGAHFPVIAADVIMAPERGLKGQIKSEPSPFSPEIRQAFEKVIAKAPSKDAIVINSVAFGKWICPREGHDAISVPTVDFDGRIIEMRTKKYHPRGYEETLDTMGRNHKLLLEAVKDFGWLGRDSLTVFFTWAGGSQNVDVLEGIYGKGALGDAKVIAERDVAAFRLAHGLELGAHGIVRLPAFLSAALMGIPGGGLFGLISRAFLEQKGLFDDMPTLAVKMLDKLFGPAWIRENPISQIELDNAEVLYIDAIQKNVNEAHRRVAEFRAKQPEDQREAPIPVEESARLLEGLVSPNYTQLLARFRPQEAPAPAPAATAEAPAAQAPAAPDEKPAPETAADGSIRFELDVQELGAHGQLPRLDRTLVAALERLSSDLETKVAQGFSLASEVITIDGALPASGRLAASARVKNGGDELVLGREFHGPDGRRIASGEAVWVLGEPKADAGVETEHLGEALGYRMPVREPLAHVYDASDALRGFLDGPALVSFAESHMRDRGLLDESEKPRTWTIRFGPRVQVGDHLLTYARREAEGYVVTVVNDAHQPVLQMTVR